MKKHFLAPDQKCAKRKIKRSIENNLNTQTRVNRSTYLKTVLRNQVFSNDRDELLQMMADSIGFENFERWITSFLLIFKPKFLYAGGGVRKCNCAKYYLVGPDIILMALAIYILLIHYCLPLNHDFTEPVFSHTSSTSDMVNKLNHILTLSSTYWKMSCELY